MIENFLWQLAADHWPKVAAFGAAIVGLGMVLGLVKKGLGLLFRASYRAGEGVVASNPKAAAGLALAGIAVAGVAMLFVGPKQAERRTPVPSAKTRPMRNAPIVHAVGASVPFKCTACGYVTTVSRLGDEAEVPCPNCRLNIDVDLANAFARSCE